MDPSTDGHDLAALERGSYKGKPPLSFSQDPGNRAYRTRFRRWGLFFLIGIGVFAVIAAVVFGVLYALGWMHCSTPTSTDAGSLADDAQKTPYSFDDIFDSSLIPRSFSSDFVGEGSKMVYRTDDGTLMEYNPATGEKQVIMDNSTFLALNTGTYFVSWDLQWVLLAYEIKNIWRYSYNAQYKIYERSTGELHNFPNHPVLQNSTLQLCRFAARTNHLAFVYDNNLYYQANPTAEAVQLTTDGNKYYIYNGIADYLYEEDVLGNTVAHYFSNGGRYLLYAKFNDTQVPLMSMTLYGPKSTMYPDIVQYPYAKPGDLRDNKPGPNTVVTLHVADLTNLQMPHWQVPPPIDLQDADHYYTSVKWNGDSTVLTFWSNRVMNRSIAMYCSVPDQSCVVNHDLEISDGWVQAPPPCLPVDGGNIYVTILPQDMGAQGRWRHLAQVTLNTDGLGEVSFLSNGSQEVLSVVGYDSSTASVYYLDTNGDPTERHLFRVGTTQAAAKYQVQECLTCDLDPGCLYVSAEFSTDGKYYVRKCHGPDIPSYTLIGIDDNLNVILENNTDVAERLSEKLLPRREFVEIDLGNGYMANAQVFYPPGYTPGNGTYRYLQDVYAGPDSKSVTKSFPIGGGTSNWLTFMGSTHNVVVTAVDGRGTYGKGEEFKFLLYKKLGNVEIEDQIAGANYFKSQPYVDPGKGAAMFGWSYGGFATAHSVGWDNHTFLCGIAVAPVTNYRYYDTAYTERFLGLASENPSGYDDADVSNKAAMFKNKIFMMNHGTADDNVQLQHFMQFSRSLINLEVQFREQLYVDENHGIGKSTKHLYQGFTDFLLNDCWNEQ